MAATLPIGFKYTAAFLSGRPQHHRFDDFSRKHPKMDRRRRAKIFAPFDALDGYSDSIDSKNVEYVERIELEEADRIELNRRLQILRTLTYNSKMARANQVKVSVRYYTPLHGSQPLRMADAGPVRDCDRDLLEGRPRGDGMHQNR